MAIYNSMLNIMPYNCRVCSGGFYAMQHVSDEARAYGLYLTELQKGEAEKDPVWNALRVEDPIFVNGFGHGNNTTYTGDTMSMIFSTTECDILAGRVVYLLSCLTANELGPAIIDVGGIAYGGYNIPWTWMRDDPNVDPYTDWYAEGFYRATNEFPITLIHGESVDLARGKCIAEYNRWLNIWETERSGDVYAADVIKWLIWDRDGLVVLGDLSATIVVAGALSTMPVDVVPPKYVKEAGEEFPFAGDLLVFDTKTPLPDRTIDLWEIGDAAPIASTKTDGEGRWGFNIVLGKGVYMIYAKFPGDDQYSPASTLVYTVEVGVLMPKIFGNTAKEYSYVTLLENQIRGSCFTCPEPGIADSVTLWLEDDLTGRIKFAIYRKSDNSLMGYTEEGINPPRGYLTLELVSGGKLAFDEYWLVCWSDSRVNTAVHTEEGKIRAGVHAEEYNAFPDFWSPATYDQVHSIYCTYTPTPFEGVEQTVELAPGESKIVSFEAVPQEVGLYAVRVNGLTGTFTAITI